MSQCIAHSYSSCYFYICHLSPLHELQIAIVRRLAWWLAKANKLRHAFIHVVYIAPSMAPHFVAKPLFTPAFYSIFPLTICCANLDHNYFSNRYSTSASLCIFILVLHFCLVSVLCPSTQSYLIFTNLKEIRRVDENNFYQTYQSNASILVNKLEEASAIDFDYENGIIFWSDNGYESIKGLRLNDTVIFDVITSGIESPDGLACDWVTKKVYWADSDNNRIEVSHYDGSDRTVLFWENLDQPRAIVLVPSEGYLFQNLN